MGKNTTVSDSQVQGDTLGDSAKLGGTGASLHDDSSNIDGDSQCMSAPLSVIVPRPSSAHLPHTPSPITPMTLKRLNKGVKDGSLTRVLVLYCGGTIGMKKDPVKGYLPLKDYLSSFLKSHDRFHDEDYLIDLQSRPPTHVDVHSMDQSLGDVLVLPHFLDGEKRVAYQIHEVG